jgi:hypothetical protein
LQEQVDREAIAVTLKASKLTAKGLAKALAALARKIQKEHQKAQTPHGKQSVEKLMNHNVPTNTIPIEGDKGLFDRVARKWNVDYAFHKTGPDKYLLLFKSGQADQTIGPALQDISPWLNGFDWLVGIAGTELLTMNTRPANPANARNLNCCIIGSSGSGKTRFWLTPNLLQAHSSFVVVDPKGGIINQVGSFLTREKYRIKVFNSIDFKKSMHYNPLAYTITKYRCNTSLIKKFLTSGCGACGKIYLYCFR